MSIGFNIRGKDRETAKELVSLEQKNKEGDIATFSTLSVFLYKLLLLSFNLSRFGRLRLFSTEHHVRSFPNVTFFYLFCVGF